MDVARAALANVVRHFEHHAEIGSTNDRAAELAREPQLATPALVVADRQTAGRGRGANRWWSADGALTFSLVIDLFDTAGQDSRTDREEALGIAHTASIGNTHSAPRAPRPASLAAPRVARERWPLVALVAGLAVCEAVQPALGSVALPAIKWPNDVYAAGRKLAGILVETSTTGASSSARVVIGIGLNVNNSFAAAPREVRQLAVSLAELTGRPHDVDAMLAAIVGELLELLPVALAEGASLVDRWRNRCLLTGKFVAIDSPAGPIAGVCEGIDESGALLVRQASGQTRCVAGTVTTWRDRP